MKGAGAISFAAFSLFEIWICRGCRLPLPAWTGSSSGFNSVTSLKLGLSHETLQELTATISNDRVDPRGLERRLSPEAQPQTHSCHSSHLLSLLKFQTGREQG